jgi:putative membrane protein
MIPLPSGKLGSDRRFARAIRARAWRRASLSGIRFESTAKLAIAAVLLGVINAVVRPIAFILTLPLTLVTLGLFLFVLNAAMVGLVARLVPGFTISGFWTAMGAAVIVWLVSWLGSSLIGSKGRLERIGK